MPDRTHGEAAPAPAAAGSMTPERAERTARALRHLAPAIAATSARVAARTELAPVVAFTHAGAAGRDPGRPA